MSVKSAAPKKRKKDKKKSSLNHKKYATLYLTKVEGARKKVIKLAQKDYIKHLWEIEGKSLREISKICNLNFRTVKKYAKEDDWNKEKKG